ncbi:hypothetical protein WMY93_015275 [Mugilogobius chulae]|uniref:Uncharacterized protein n=1 Tax=Mugilogobius chulae TaxID=88201 RepID=A0AAW0NU12_9GOBI
MGTVNPPLFVASANQKTPAPKKGLKFRTHGPKHGSFGGGGARSPGHGHERNRPRLGAGLAALNARGKRLICGWFESAARGTRFSCKAAMPSPSRLPADELS